MNIWKRIIFFKTLLFLLTISNAHSNPSKTLTIFAEPNLSPALTQIARLYSQDNATVISIEFGLASDMIHRIELGEPSDLFISAHKIWIDNLKQKGLVDIYNVNHITDDTLALVTSAQNNNIPKSLKEKGLGFEESLLVLNKNRFDLLIDHDSSSLGQHSEALVDNNKFRSLRLFKKLPEDRSSVIDLASNNSNIYSILLGSQINDSARFKVISRLKNRKVFYQALVIAGDNMGSAREFSNFLKSERSQRIFRSHGFVGNYVN